MKLVPEFVKIVFLSAILFINFGCADSHDQSPDDTPQTSNSVSQSTKNYRLPSGKEIKINNISKVDFPNGDSALVMNYETDISIDDMENLRKEIDEVWSIFKNDVEQAGLKAGVIRATHLEGTGIIRNGKVYGFVFTKNKQGKWQLKENLKEK